MRTCQAHSARDPANFQGLQFAPEIVAKQTYNDRAVAGLVKLRDRKKFVQRELAEASGMPASSLSRVWQKTQPVTLKMLDAVETLTGVNALTLLADETSDERVEPVTGSERRLLGFLRSLPAPTREALLVFFSFFANDDPETHDEKVAFEQLRRLKPHAVKRRAYAYLTFLSEGGLTPDLQAAFGLLETNGRTPKRQRRRTTTA